MSLVLAPEPGGDDPVPNHHALRWSAALERARERGGRVGYIMIVGLERGPLKAASRLPLCADNARTSGTRRQDPGVPVAAAGRAPSRKCSRGHTLGEVVDVGRPWGQGDQTGSRLNLAGKMGACMKAADAHF
jgi:hypothetical protein